MRQDIGSACPATVDGMPDPVPVYVVDAFTESAFGGNPAGIVLLDGPREDAWLQSVAAEMRHSETAFLEPLPDPSLDPAPIGLRWFTPTVEIDLCGHATLASGHVLYRLGFTGRLSFSTRSGILAVDPGPAGSLVLDFPARPPSPASDVPGLADALGAIPVWVGRGGDRDVFVEVRDESTLRSLMPDFAKLSTVEARGVIVTALADNASTYDVVTRFFAPASGINEDPVTGSAHTAVAPYWAQRLGCNDLVGYQASERGGVIQLQVVGDRVRLGGHAVTILEGMLVAPVLTFDTTG